MAGRFAAFWNHPAGPKTIHFWAPTFKWGISIANIADFQKPPEKLSYPQQSAVTATGIVWSRYSTQIIPVNYNLLSVNAFMALTGLYQLSRMIRCDSTLGGRESHAAVHGGQVPAGKSLRYRDWHAHQIEKRWDCVWMSN
eukprot:jgi/Mesvir1/22729/Mv14135-RA.1